MKLLITLLLTSLLCIPVVRAQQKFQKEKVPHDNNLFTQGLIVNNNIAWESSGGFGKSLLRKWDLISGQVIKQVKIPKKYFAEGLTELNNKLYLVTWQSGVALVFDKESLKTLKAFKYKGEGWGLTSDSKQLILSNGSNIIQFIDPETFKTTREINVKLDGFPITQLNELEWINNHIWANVWQTDHIVVINPENGDVIKSYYLPTLLNENSSKPGVLNGIAYDEIQKKIWLTGKNWPYMFNFPLENPQKGYNSD